MTHTIVLLALMLLSWSYGDDCTEGYSKAMEFITLKHESNKSKLKKRDPGAHYTYKFININSFPYFCVDDDTLVNNIKKGKTIYFCYSSILANKKGTRIQVPVLSYITWNKDTEPENKLYYLYFLEQDSSKKWIEYKNPLIVNLILTNKRKAWYGCL